MNKEEYDLGLSKLDTEKDFVPPEKSSDVCNNSTLLSVVKWFYQGRRFTMQPRFYPTADPDVQFAIFNCEWWFFLEVGREGGELFEAF